jgi:hypothetical protein
VLVSCWWSAVAAWLGALARVLRGEAQGGCRILPRSAAGAALLGAPGVLAGEHGGSNGPASTNGKRTFRRPRRGVLGYVLGTSSMSLLASPAPGVFLEIAVLVACPGRWPCASTGCDSPSKIGRAHRVAAQSPGSERIGPRGGTPAWAMRALREREEPLRSSSSCRGHGRS